MRPGCRVGTAPTEEGGARCPRFRQGGNPPASEPEASGETLPEVGCQGIRLNRIGSGSDLPYGKVIRVSMAEDVVEQSAQIVQGKGEQYLIKFTNLSRYQFGVGVMT